MPIIFLALYAAEGGQVGGGGYTDSVPTAIRQREKKGWLSFTCISHVLRAPSIFHFTRCQLVGWLSLFNAELSPKRP